MIDVNRPQDRLHEKAADTRHDIAEIGHIAKEIVQDKLQQIGEKTAATYEEGKEKLHNLSADLLNLVRRCPVKSVLIASGVGLLLGVLWRRK